MKKFNYELLQMNKDKVIQLFGINKDIENQSFIYNKLLLSISENNSTITENKSISYNKNDDLNKNNKSAIEVEKFLINLSSELFLFNYIIKQFDKDKLIQIPRMLFFCCLYDNECRNIYQIQSEKKKQKVKEKMCKEDKIIIKEKEKEKEKEE